MDQEHDSVEEIAAKAAEFAARVHDPDASEEDWLALESWLEQDADHVTAYDKAERLWLELEEARDVLKAPRDEPGAKVIRLEPRRRRHRPWPLAAGGVAAAAALAVAMSPVITGSRLETYRTAPGEMRTLTLKDGTTVHLNGGSTVSVRLGLRERRVQMGLAEASFDVAKDKGRPFVIDAGDVDVRVVGTEFNVSRYPDRTSVTVRRGVVEVTPDGGGEVARLTPGKSLIRFQGRSTVREVDADAAFAWRQGRLVYDSAPLSQVALDISRRFSLPVEVRGPARDLAFTGVLVLDEEDAVVRRLERFLPILVERSDSGIVLTSR